MKCAVHPDVDATGFCRNCGKPMCPVCVRPVRDVLYCEDCLANVWESGAVRAVQRSRLCCIWTSLRAAAGCREPIGTESRAGFLPGIFAGIGSVL